MRKRSSFWGILSRDVSEAPQVVIDRIRRAMLLALAQHGDPESNLVQDGVELGIRFATTLEELWYLRPELLQIILQRLDAQHAQQTMLNITQLFDGHKHS
jgi:hypothetical protein